MLSLGLKGIIATSPGIVLTMLFCSVLLFAFFLERLIYYHFHGAFPKKLWEKVSANIAQGNIKDALNASEHSDNAYGKLFAAALKKASFSRTDVEDALFIAKEEIQEEFRSRLGLFGTLAFISPLIGLLGTVLGIYRAFHDLALSGTGGPAIIAAGVSEALVATAIGIIVAVPAAVIYNYFTFRLRSIIVNLNSYGQYIVLALFEKGKHL